MKKQRMYHSNFSHNGWRKKKGEKSRGHNLRAKNALEKLYMNSVTLDEICDPDLIINNLLFIDNEKVDPVSGDEYFEAITKLLEEEKKEYLNKLERSYSDSNKAELSSKRALAKAALKRYANGSEDLEKEYWNDLVARLGSNEIDPEEEISKLKSTTTGKIKRFNQKISRIKELKEYNCLLGVKSRNTAFTVFSKEVLYKIPDDTPLSIKPADLARFVNNMNQRLYPDFKATYIVIHCDENPDNPHAHCEFSGKNLKTGEMDIQQQLFFNLEKELNKKNKTFLFKNKTYNDLDFDEVQRFGQIYQDFIFEEMNAFLNKNGYKANLEKRSEQEKKTDLRKFLDQKKPTQKREFTRAKKLQEENKKVRNNNNKLIDKQKLLFNQIKTTNNEIKNKNEELTSIDEKLKKTYKELSVIEKVTINVLSVLEAAFEFSTIPNKKNLLSYKEKFQSIRNAELEDKIKEESVEIQPTQNQKSQIKNVKSNMKYKNK